MVHGIENSAATYVASCLILLSKACCSRPRGCMELQQIVMPPVKGRKVEVELGREGAMAVETWLVYFFSWVR